MNSLVSQPHPPHSLNSHSLPRSLCLSQREPLSSRLASSVCLYLSVGGARGLCVSLPHSLSQLVTFVWRVSPCCQFDCSALAPICGCVFHVYQRLERVRAPGSATFTRGVCLPATTYLVFGSGIAYISSASRSMRSVGLSPRTAVQAS